MVHRLSVLLFVSLLFLQGTSTTCLGLPSAISPGQGCNSGSGLSCESSSFCHPKTSVCTRRLKEGENCKDAVCEDGLTCRGPTDFQTCQMTVSPGNDCSRVSSESLPACGRECSGAYLCEEGLLGDSCRGNTCANNLTCTNGVCTGVGIGGACLIGAGHYVCTPEAFCDSTTATCVTRRQPGGPCTDDRDCVFKSFCIGVNSTDTNRKCVEFESLPAGSYCDGQGYLCASRRCSNDFCAANPVEFCTSSSQCSFDQVCTCGSVTLTEGLGNCRSNSCIDKYAKFAECADICGDSKYFNGSCVDLNCRKEWQRSFDCGDGSSLTASFLSVSLLALLASVMSRGL